MLVGIFLIPCLMAFDLAPAFLGVYASSTPQLVTVNQLRRGNVEFTYDSFVFDTMCSEYSKLVDSRFKASAVITNLCLGYFSTSAPTAQTLSLSSLAPDFDVSAFPPCRTIANGTTTTFVITVSSLNDFSLSVYLSVSSHLADLNGTFSLNPVAPTANGSAQSILTVNAASTAAAGSYRLTIVGTSGDQLLSTSHSTSVTLVVTVTTPTFAQTPTIAVKSAQACRIQAYVIPIVSSIAIVLGLAYLLKTKRTRSG